MSDEQHERRLNAMKYKIIKAERENLKSQRVDEVMVKLIRNIIIDEAKRIYGGTQNVN